MPTGLGKTFIAAVVMYNMFRWYPNKKIIFMAPTRPLVAQQIDACYRIMGIPKEETAELTGKQLKRSRSAIWQTKCVFFATPQVVWSDLNDPDMNFPIDDIKLIVIDEAHKAKGKYAYTEVVQSIMAQNQNVRILALSATPGRNIRDVCEVIQNLHISHVEVRGDNSIDVAPYIHKKNIQTIVVKMDEFLRKDRDNLIALIEPYLQNLINHQVVSGHIGNMTKGWLILDRNRFRESTLQNRHPAQTSIFSDFSICMGLYHALEQLERYGARACLNYFDDNDSSTDEKYFVLKNENIKRFVNELRNRIGPNPFANLDHSFYGNVSTVTNDDNNDAIDYGHPKFEILKKSILKHFTEHEDTKAIIFCEYRDSVFLIYRMLLECQPIVKSKVFVGKFVFYYETFLNRLIFVCFFFYMSFDCNFSYDYFCFRTGQGYSHSRSITQKEQIAVMNDFRKGVCNTLIATCVAEEGIDVGEVDLIVCFDVSNRNPIRFTQRIGRTGRKRQGKVIMLVTEGREQFILKDVLATKDGTNQKITKSHEVNHVLYKNASRMVPYEFNPECLEVFIKIDDEKLATTSTATASQDNSDLQSIKPTKSTGKRKTKEKSNKNTNDLRKFFKPIEMDDEIRSNFDISDFYEKQSIPSDNNNSKSTTTSLNEPSTSVISVNETDNMSVMSKLTNICERYCAIKTSSSSRTSITASDVLNDDKISKVLKLMWLKNNIDVIREHFIRKTTSKLYATIVDVIGSERDIINLLNANNNKSNWQMLTDNQQISIHTILQIADNNVNDDKENSIEEQNNNSKIKINHETQSDQINYFIDSQLQAPIFINDESKYESQRAQLHIKSPEPSTSTKREILSSTPITTSKHRKTNHFNSPAHTPIKNSPLLKAFERSMKLSNKKVNRKPHYLTYLGLNTIDDLFKDRNKIENVKISFVANSDDDDIFVESHFDENVRIIEPKDSIKQNPTQESHMNVSRILQICDEEDEKEREMNIGNTLVSSNRTKRLHIGSISDIFRDVDFDSDEFVTLTATSNGEQTKKNNGNTQGSQSDSTIEYDVEVPSTVAEDDNDEMQTSSNKENLVKQNSTDLFASISEFNDSELHRSVSYPCCNTKNRNLFIRNASSTSHLASSPPNRSNIIMEEPTSPSIFGNKSFKSQKSQNSMFTQQSNSPCCSTKLNLTRLRSIDSQASSNGSQSAFLTCRESVPITRIDNNNKLLNSFQITDKSTSESVESSSTSMKAQHNSEDIETPDEDEIFATCPTVRKINWLHKSEKRKENKFRIVYRLISCVSFTDETTNKYKSL